jgi:hypothetical protein
MMRYQFATAILVVAVVACKSRTDSAAASTSVVTQAARSTAAPAPSADGQEEAQISGGRYDPIDPDGNTPDSHSRFNIAVELFASGRMVLALDTLWPRVYTEGTNPTRTVTDSLVVTGVSAKENWTYNCTRSGAYEPFVVAVIPMLSPAARVPRLAWKFDTATYRIRPFPPDSILCAGLSD